MTRPSVRELHNELETAALAVGSMELARLRRLGVCNSAVARMGYRHHQFGVAAVVDRDEGRFAPDPHGARKLIVPVYENGELIDLVALSTEAPDEWSLRTGAGLALGLFDGWEPYRWQNSVPLQRDPLSWLVSGGLGLCVVNWDAPELYLINDLPGITVPDAAFAATLSRCLSRPAKIVPIIVREMRHAA